MLKKYREKIKNYFKEVLEVKATPKEIAIGFTVGTAIAILPTFGLGPFIALLIILIFKRISKISLLFSFVVWNPFILISLYPLEYYIGDLLVGNVQIKFKLEILNQIFVYSFRYLIGNIIITIVFCIISYFTIYYLIKKFHKKDIPVISEIDKAIVKN
mgnify:FL=1